MVAHISELQPSITVQFSLVTQLCPILRDPMDCSTPGFPVYHQFLKLAQTHVHCVGDAIQPSRPLSSPSPAFSLPHHQCFFLMSRLFTSGGQIIGTLASNEYSGLISFRID